MRIEALADSQSGPGTVRHSVMPPNYLLTTYWAIDRRAVSSDAIEGYSLSSL